MAILYSKRDCPFCEKTKKLLEQLGVEYVEYDVEKDKAKAEEMVRKTGQGAVPVLELNGRVIIGYDEKAIRRAAELPPRTREDFLNNLFYDPFDM